MVKQGKRFRASRLDRPLAEGVRVGEKPNLFGLYVNAFDTASMLLLGIVLNGQQLASSTPKEGLEILSVATLVVATVFVLHKAVLHRYPRLYFGVLVVVEVLLLVLDRAWFPGKLVFLNFAVLSFALAPLHVVSIFESIRRIRNLNQLNQ